MHIHTVPARTGLHWLQLGFQMFWRQPLAWLLLSAFIAGSLLMPRLSGVGPALNLALMPLQCLLMLGAATLVHTGQRLSPAALLAAIRCHLGRLPHTLAMYALYAIAAYGPLVWAALINDSDMALSVLNMKPMDREAAAVPQNMSLVLYWSIWVCALSPSIWFAPGLVLWHGVAPGKALWLSTVACLRNWRSLLVLFVLSMGILAVASVAVLVVAVLLLKAAPQSAAMRLLAMALSSTIMVLVIPLVASTILSLRDCFSAQDTPPAAPAGAGLNAV